MLQHNRVRMPMMLRHNRIEDPSKWPPRRPNHLKVLAGEQEDRINRGEPLPAEATITPPVQLSDGAQKVWDRLAPDLIDKGCLTGWDVDMFAVFCDAAATYHDCRGAIGNDYTTKGSVNRTRSG